jgi:hypothetical protein
MSSQSGERFGMFVVAFYAGLYQNVLLFRQARFNDKLVIVRRGYVSGHFNSPWELLDAV